MVRMFGLRDVSGNDPVKIIVEVQISPGRQNPAGIIAVRGRVLVVRPGEGLGHRGGCTGPSPDNTRA